MGGEGRARMAVAAGRGAQLRRRCDQRDGSEGPVRKCHEAFAGADMRVPGQLDEIVDGGDGDAHGVEGGEHVVSILPCDPARDEAIELVGDGEACRGSAVAGMVFGPIAADHAEHPCDLCVGRTRERDEAAVAAGVEIARNPALDPAAVATRSLAAAFAPVSLHLGEGCDREAEQLQDRLVHAEVDVLPSPAA